PAQRLGDGRTVGHHPRAVDRASRLRGQLDEQRPRTVPVHPRGRPVRDGDDDHAGGGRPAHPDRRQWPALPPVFSSTRTSVTTASGSRALTMSTSPSAAVITQVSASISTPVRSAVRTVALMSTPLSTTVSATST